MHYNGIAKYYCVYFGFLTHKRRKGPSRESSIARIANQRVMRGKDETNDYQFYSLSTRYPSL